MGSVKKNEPKKIGGVEVKRSLPVNISASHKSLFEHELSRILVPNVILPNFDSWSIRNKYDKIVLESTTFLYRLIGKRVFKPCLNLAPRWRAGYFHWLTEDLLIVLLASKIITKPFDVILPKKLNKLSYIRESLAVFPEASLIFLDKKSVLNYESIFTVEHLLYSGNYIPAEIQSLRKIILNHFVKEAKNNSLKLYISRSNAQNRKVLNESEVYSDLIKLGFKIIFTEQLTFSAQVVLFNQASIIVGPHGAGLTNMMFLKKNAKVVEIRAENDRKNNCYFALASTLDLQYYYILAERIESNDHIGDFKLKPNAFIDQLTEIEQNKINN